MIAVLVICAWFNVAVAAAQEPLRGVALIIGNGDYDSLLSLPNPDQDAEAIETLLDQLGFDTALSTDRNAKRLKRDLDNFLDDAQGADVALFYYAGHGIEAGGQNFIVPVDADAKELEQGADRLVPLNGFLQKLRQTVPMAIVLIDACRINPFPSDFRLRLDGTREPLMVAATGLSAPARTRGSWEKPTKEAEAEKVDNLATLVGFAAEPGRAAFDGPAGGNSPYATALLRHLGATSGVSFSNVMSMVAEEVYLKTSGEQRPWVNQSLRRQLFFGAAEILDADNERLVSERRNLLLHVAALPMGQRQAAESLSQKGKVPLDVVFAVLKAAGIAENESPQIIEERLKREIDRFAEIRAARKTLLNPDPEIQRLSELADKAELEGALQTANYYREKAKDRVSELRLTRNEQIQALKDRISEDAIVYERAAETKELLFQFSAAAADYGSAFEIIADWDVDKAFEYRRWQISLNLSSFIEQGNEVDLKTADDLALQEINTPSAPWNNFQKARFYKFAGQIARTRFEIFGGDQNFAQAEDNLRQALELNEGLDRRETGILWGDLAGLFFVKASGENDQAGLQRAEVLYLKGLSIIDPNSQFGSAIEEFDQAKRDQNSKIIEEKTNQIVAELDKDGGMQLMRDYAWFKAQIAAAQAGIARFDGQRNREAEAVRSYYLAVQSHKVLGDFKEMAAVLRNRGNLYFRRADRGDKSAASHAFKNYQEALNELSPQSHPVLYLRVFESMSSLVLEHHKDLDGTQIAAVETYAEQWRSETSNQSLEARNESFENKMGRLLFTRGLKTSDVASYEKALEWYEKFHDLSANSPADQAVARFNQGLVQKEIGLLQQNIGSLRTARALFSTAEQIYQSLDQVDNAIEALHQDAGIAHELGLLTKSRDDYAAAFVSYQRVAKHWNFEKQGKLWAHLLEDLGNIQLKLAFIDEDIDGLEIARSNFGDAADAFDALNLTAERMSALQGDARTTHNIASLKKDAALFEIALGKYRSLLYSGDRISRTSELDLQTNIGLVLRELGRIKGDDNLLRQSAQSFAGAIEVGRRSPQLNHRFELSQLASTMLELAILSGAMSDFDLATKSYETLLLDAAEKSQPVERGILHNDLAYAYVLSNRIAANAANLARAVLLSGQAQEILQKAGNVESLAYARTTACDALGDTAARDRDLELAENALTLCKQGLSQLEKAGDVEAIEIAKTSIVRLTELMRKLAQ